MDYIEQMSYGLKEHGFLTHYLEESDKDTSNGRVYLKNKKGKKTEVTSEDFRKENEDEEAEFDEEEGVYRSSDTGKIIAGCSDFIMQYIISDNYMYTIRNFNLDTNWWTAIFDHIAALFGDDMSNRKGMIYLIHDTGSIGTINLNDVKLISKDHSLFNIIFLKIKDLIQSNFDQNVSNVMLGILLGYTDEINEDIRERFSESNISHILAVSGMHVG